MQKTVSPTDDGSSSTAAAAATAQFSHSRMRCHEPVIGLPYLLEPHSSISSTRSEDARKRKFRRCLPPRRRTNAVKRHSEQKCLPSLSPCISRNIKRPTQYSLLPLLTRAAVSVESRNHGGAREYRLDDDDYIAPIRYGCGC
jgi:hypothetical protein